MNTIQIIRNSLSRVLAGMIVPLMLVNCNTASSQPGQHLYAGMNSMPVIVKDQRVMLALLLDTSNSMDGLIEQAKSQLWKIVNDLAGAKCGDGSRPQISIALYEYGNSGLSEGSGYIRMVSPLTTDLDLISEKLFSLRTNGGSEYCGQVINTSVQQLGWSDSDNDLKLIFIAGNEPFTQGFVPYDVACRAAKGKGIVVNTIFCGSFDEGVSTSWRDGASITNGTYMSIEQDRATVYIETPYDARIDALNDQLNATYIYYGTQGNARKENQLMQDKNAEQYSRSNKVERTLSKSSHAYKNSSWDLVDASKDDSKAIEKARENDLPDEMKSMTIEQRKVYIQQKAAEREKISQELQQLSKERNKYIELHNSNAGNASLDAAMLKAIHEKAHTKHLTW